MTQMLATAYCNKFGAGSINGQTGITHNGTDLRDGKQHYVIAAGPGSGLKMGDTVAIKPNPFNDLVVWTVADTGNLIAGRHIDLYIADCKKAKDWGRKTVEVVKVSGTTNADTQIKAPNLNPVSGIDAVAKSVGDVAGALKGVITTLTSSATWFRVGKVLVGVLIGIYGFMILTRPAVNALPPSVKSAAKVAAIA